MTLTREGLNRKVGVIACAFAAGVLAVVLGVAVLDSPWIVGIALLWLVAIAIYGFRALRCPVCGTPILHASPRAATTWLLRDRRRCPFCKQSWFDPFPEHAAEEADATSPS